jgi:hypothetical protein
MTNSLGVACSVLSITWLALTSGCAENEPPPAEVASEQPPAAPAEVSVPAGKTSAALGIDHWSLLPGHARGVDARGETVAEFSTPEEGREIVTVIGTGSHRRALGVDMEAFANASLEADGVGPSAAESFVPQDGGVIDKASPAECVQCLNACAGGAVTWDYYCAVMPYPQLKAGCWALVFAGTVACEGWCYWYMCP